jgi:hypothetical protein
MNSAPASLPYVPTLTEMIEPVPLSLASVLAFSPTASPADVCAPTPEPAPPLSADAQELIVQRVLQRIDDVLAQRLQQAVERVLQAHSQALALGLREEVTLMVRESVAQAFEQP